mmetsp:Transcript_26678/g.76493  ORF Transcript_26678/g.76493 Transcript_26678/m.76493 type:complete len:201 (-) Transcript_26678:230-832(-)
MHNAILVDEAHAVEDLVDEALEGLLGHQSLRLDELKHVPALSELADEEEALCVLPTVHPRGDVRGRPVEHRQVPKAARVAQRLLGVASGLGVLHERLGHHLDRHVLPLLVVVAAVDFTLVSFRLTQEAHALVPSLARLVVVLLPVADDAIVGGLPGMAQEPGHVAHPLVVLQTLGGSRERLVEQHLFGVACWGRGRGCCC